MTELEKQKMIEKVRKLLALAASSNEHEAALAAERAQSILADYNLSMDDVATKERTLGDDFIVDKEIVNDSYPWKRQIAVNVAKLYFCDYYFQSMHYDEKYNRYKVRQDRHAFVGAPHNIEVAKMMFVYLITTVERLAREGMKQEPAKGRDAYRRSFQWAASLRLATRLRERYEAAQRNEVQSEAGTNLPALASLYSQTANALNKYIADNVGGMRTKKTRPNMSSAAGAAHGRAAGDRIGLDTQVGSRNPGHLLGRK